MKGIEELSVHLEQLFEHNVSCEQFSQSMKEYSFVNIDNVFANLHHYLSDEDIRSKDKEYDLMQIKELEKLIRHLRKRNLESANAITFLHET